MPTFDTPAPISVALELVIGDVQITASERSDTLVEVRPTDENEPSDVSAAEHTRVQYLNGRLQVSSQKARALDFSATSRSVQVTIALPTGSTVVSKAAVGDFECRGELASCEVKTATGNIQLDTAGSLQFDTATGHVTVERATGDARVSTRSGRVRIGELAGTAVIKNSNGSTWIGTTHEEVTVRAANGDIAIDRVLAAATARTANGSVRVMEAAGGPVELQTSMGDLEIGIAEGTAAWLDLTVGYGRVRNALQEAPAAAEGDRTVEVRAHTKYGDITVDRSEPVQ